MPARAPSSTAAQLLAVLHGMTPEARHAFVSALPPEEKALLERAYAVEQQAGWRANPATMGQRLFGRADYRYAVVLGEHFAGALMGTMHNRQQWSMPSQYGKTTSLGDGVLWGLDYNPRLRFMYVTYDDNKANELGGDLRDLAEAHSADLRFRLRKDRRARGQWKTEQGGGLYTVGVDGAITGYPADVLLLDDLLKGWEAAHSASQRAHVLGVYRSQCRMRIQGDHSPIIMAGTRWHEADVPGVLMAEADVDQVDADQWLHVRMPAVAEVTDPHAADPSMRAADPLGRELGEVLEPRRFSEREVRARARALGSYLAAALEQQRPSPEEGNIVKRAWFKLESQLPVAPDEWLASWDLKLKDNEQGDYVVGQVWCRTGSQMWLCDQLRGQWGQEKTVLAIALLMVRWPQVVAVWIEAAGLAPEVMRELRRAAPGYVVDDATAAELGMGATEREAVQEIRRHGLPGLLPNPVKGDKGVRLRAQVPLMEAGDVHVLATAPWLAGWLDEMAAFPNGAHADQVDCTTQALLKLSRGAGTAELPAQGTLAARGPNVASGLVKPPTRAGGSVGQVGPGRRLGR